MEQFRSTTLSQKWAALHKERQEVIDKNIKKNNPKNDERLDIISSLMTSCKKGFLLPDAKIKKIIKFLKEKTGCQRVRYGALPENSKQQSILFKDIVVIYTDKDGQIVFREQNSKL